MSGGDGALYEALSVDAMPLAKASQSNQKAVHQAEANVLRQQATTALRGGKPSASSKASEPAPKAAAPKKKEVDKGEVVKDMARKLNKISRYMTTASLSPHLHGIQMPMVNTPESVDLVLSQIEERLNGGIGDAAVKGMWLSMMKCLDRPMSQLPGGWAVPPGSSNMCALRMHELQMQFDMLSIEYGHFFSSGPLVQLIMKTGQILFDYKSDVESGKMPMLVDNAPPILDQPPQQQMHNDQASSSGSWLPPESPEPVMVPKVPPPMKLYADPVDDAPAFIIKEDEPAPSAPVFSSDPPKSAPSRGRGKKRGGI